MAKVQEAVKSLDGDSPPSHGLSSEGLKSCTEWIITEDAQNEGRIFIVEGLWGPFYELRKVV